MKEQTRIRALKGREAVSLSMRSPCVRPLADGRAARRLPDSIMTPCTFDGQNRSGLGIDAGGTQTRWALARADGTVVAEGHVGGMSALQMQSAAGRTAMDEQLMALAAAVLPYGRPHHVRAGFTGCDGDGSQIEGALARVLGVPAGSVAVCSDIELAYAASLRPGQGYLVYAGTGSIAAYVDCAGTLHRAGGRGAALDDGGGGYWIAREALRAIWRAEDECPGQWRSSPMAHAIFERIGGSDWAQSRTFMYGQERGVIGSLALAVAASAAQDPAAADILCAAGQELARLARALAVRHGPRPVVLGGRAGGLHPLISASMRQALPAGTSLTRSTSCAHVMAAIDAAASRNTQGVERAAG